MSSNIYRTEPELRLDQRFLAATVGAVAVFLPVVLWVGCLINPPLRQSISHCYYMPFFGDVLVGSLIFIGTFLIAYRGLLPRERCISNVAGLAAYGVALFPTSGPGILRALFLPGPWRMSRSPPMATRSRRVRWVFSAFPGVDYLHFGSAAVLFGFLAYCALFVFTRRSAQNPHDAGGRPKKMRNGIYLVCGVVILLSMMALLAKLLFGLDAEWNKHSLTFVFETTALWAFGASWLVKGRFFMKATFLMDGAELNERSHR